MTEPFATPQEVSDRLGRDLAPDEITQLTALIADTTAAIVLRVDNDFTTGTATETHRSVNNRIVLDRWPLQNVVSITAVEGDADEVVVKSKHQATLRGRGEFTIEYEYGFEAKPPALIGLVANIAKRAATSGELAGYTSETVAGTYTVQMGAAAAAGPVGLLSSEREIVDQFKRRLGRGGIGTIPLDSWLV